MWQNTLSGILGLWIILVVILGFSSTLRGFFLIVSGLLIALLGFWSNSLMKSSFENPENPEEAGTEKRENGGENNA
jgi:hypothetical protein